jgi:hypothetical protein
MTLLAHHQLLLAIPFAGPVLAIFVVLAYLNLRDRRRSRRASSGRRRTA